MITYEQLLRCDPAVFGRQGDKWQDMAAAAHDRAQDLDDQLSALADWQGADADAATATLRGHHRKLQDIADHFDQIPDIFADAQDTFTRAKQEVLLLVQKARQNGLAVNGKGQFEATVLTNGGSINPVEGGQLLAMTFNYQLGDLLRNATEADVDFAARLRELTAQATGFAAPPTSPTSAAAAIPPHGTSPAAVKKWWDSLPPMDRESLLFTQGKKIGALDGIPIAVRDRANRAEVAEELNRLRERAARGIDSPEIRAKIDGIQDIQDRLNSRTTDIVDQAYLIDFDTEGTGRAVISAGDPDTATHVTTNVPGTGSNLSGIDKDMERMDRMWYEGSVNGGQHAVVTWLGYDAPPDPVAAINQEPALDARDDLDRFQDGLRATHEGPASHNTMLGHSYGATLIGLTAAGDGLAADALVFAGSPGEGIGVDHVTDLKLDGISADQLHDRVHATVADNDIISDTANMHYEINDPLDPILGPDPTHDRFGATVFESDPGTPNIVIAPNGAVIDLGPTIAAHSEYWELGSKSLDEFGHIMAGERTPPR